jgi:hypothetical protein
LLIERLHEAEGIDIPEIHVCRICLEGAHAIDDLFPLLALPLWEPVRILAYRALAFFGRRTTLSRALLTSGTFGLLEADAWLEAARSADSESMRVSAPDSDWKALIVAETNPDANEMVLANLANRESKHEGMYARSEASRISARATAALARLALARGAGEALRLTQAKLPPWEDAYLQGLSFWQHGDKATAREFLREALARNPQQTCTRLALSSLVAEQFPEEALDLTQHAEPSRDLLIHRAALLARMTRYDDAELVLRQDAPWEALRCSWPSGQSGLRRQEQLLRTALAERGGRWKEAEKHWQAVCKAGDRRALRETRELFIAHTQLCASAALGNWTRESIERKVVRLKRELAEVQLTGDASFFRSAVLVDLDPGRAARDLQTLSRRRVWQDAERSVGGGRLVFVGDALLRLGKGADANLVYRSLIGCRDRVAVASAYAGLLRGATQEELVAAAEVAPDSPWPKLLVVVALLMKGKAPLADDLLKTAQQQGAPAALCETFETLSRLISGTVRIDKNSLAALRLRPELSAAVHLQAGSESQPLRAAAYVHALGDRWIEFCPTNPQSLARVLLSTWCAEGRWDEALLFARRLALSTQTWATELATLTQVRHALECACRGKLVEAEKELEEFSNGIVS